MRSRLHVSLLAALVFLVSVPLAEAQSAVVGEASSPALIEKVRSATSDENGQYRIIELRPGTYTVTFTLTGFQTVIRPGVVLETNFTAPINVEMRLGSVEETITVTG